MRLGIATAYETARRIAVRPVTQLDLSHRIEVHPSVQGPDRWC